MNGDQSHFVHSEEVLESWRIVDDLLCVGENCPIRTAPYVYMPGSWGPHHKTDQNHSLGLSCMNPDQKERVLQISQRKNQTT